MRECVGVPAAAWCVVVARAALTLRCVADVQPGSAGARLPARCRRRQAVLPLLVLLLLLLLVLLTFTYIASIPSVPLLADTHNDTFNLYPPHHLACLHFSCFSLKSVYFRYTLEQVGAYMFQLHRLYFIRIPGRRPPLQKINNIY